MSDGGRLKRFLPLILAVLVGSTAGLLGAFSNRSSPSRPSADAPGVEGAQPADVQEGGAARLMLKPGQLAALTRIAVSCNGRGVSATVTVDRLGETISTRSWSRIAQVSTDAAGVSSQLLASGTWLISARASGEPGCAGADAVVSIKEGDRDPHVELALGAGRRVVGQVVEAGASARPVEGALVTVLARRRLPGLSMQSVGSEQPLSATTDSFGRFAIDGLFAERAIASASAQAFADGSAEIGTERAPTVRLELKKSARLSGVVRGGQPPVSIAAYPGDAAGSMANADGSFRLEVPPVDTLLIATSGDGQRAMLRVANLQSGEERGGLVLTVEPAGTVRGVTVDATSGAAVPCAEVWLRPESDDVEVSRTHAGADGSFTLERVPAGRFWLQAKCDSGESGEQLGIEPSQAEAHSIAMHAAASLTGRVTNREGMAVPRIDIDVTAGRRASVTAITDDDGRFLLEHLPASVVDVDAHAPGKLAQTQQVQLREAALTEVALVVDDTGTIRGTVTGKVFGMRRPVITSGDKRLTQAIDVDAENAYRVEVPAGDYRVGTWSHGGFQSQHEVTVRVGETVLADVSLEGRAGTSTGAVGPGELGVSFENTMQGPTVSWVVANGPAQLAGVQLGDVVAAIDAEPVKDSIAAFERARGKPGSTAQLTVKRDGKEQRLVVVRAGTGE